MKLVRVVLSIAVLIVIVGAIAVTALVMFINPNKLKPVIAAELKNQTGYEAVIDGTFSWSFYPRVGVKVEHIALRVPGQVAPFVDLNNIIFVTELTQLLQGNEKLRGDIYIANVKLLNIQAQNAHVGLSWQDQVLTLQPITAHLYDGVLTGVAHGSNLSLLPHWDWDIKLSQIQLHPLLLDVNGAASKLNMSGVGEITIRAGAQGNSREQILSSLNGSSEFNLKNGVVEGVDLNYLVTTADAIINKQPLSSPTGTSQTEFESFTGTATIKNGVVVTNDMALTSSALKTSGAGSINLPYEVINMQLRVVPQKDIKTQWVIPVMVTGNLYRPDVRLDATELNIMVAKEKLENVKAKVRDEIKEHFSGKSGEVLQNILGK